MDFGFGWIDLRVGRAWAGKRSQGCEVVEDSGKAESAGPAKRRLPPREKLLDAAEALFYANGIHSVGIDRILAETSVAKATLYRHFPSKDDLVAAYLTRRHERVIAGMAEAAQAPLSARDRARNIFDQLQAKANSADFRGCAFAMAVAEYAGNPDVTGIARRHKAAVRSIFADLAAEAGGPPAAGTHMALLYEGALASFSVNRDPDQIAAARDCALEVLARTAG
jgi:AcrR family transcriptional regulator